MFSLRVASAGIPISFADICFGFKSCLSKDSSIVQFQDKLRELVGCKYCFLLNSGTTSFYLVLKALQRFSKKTEVILPAYTSPSLILPIKKLGLRPVLCDISLRTFSLDIDKLSFAVSDDTLCIVPVHMFGIPCQMKDIMEMAKRRDIFVFEDSASALGSCLDQQMVGKIGDAGCFSFNRGKNITTFTGGCITTNCDDLALRLREELKTLKPMFWFSRLLMPFKLMLLALVIRPFFYTIFYPLICMLKSRGVHKDFIACRYTDFQAGVGLSLSKRIEEFSKQRHKNGIYLFAALKNIKSIYVPEIVSESIPAFNQFPVVFKDQMLRDRLHRELIKKGIEVTIFYQRPLHHFYDLGYDKNKESFPNATFMAARLLLLPTHPLMNESKLKIIVGLFEELK